ncbi:MAG: MFS transporter [Actinomycetota bacterium]|nr:MFS transporter [Actinomycetota bacterium]
MAQTRRGSIRRLALAAAVSGIGDWAATIALSLVIFRETHSTVWLSASFFFIQAPKGFLAPVAGAMADRFDRRRLLIASELLAAATYGLMIVVRAPILLIALGAVAALFSLPSGPAASAAVPNLIGGEELSWANGTIAAAFRVGTLVGPAIGGAVYASAGAGVVFAVNAVSFVASAALIAQVRGDFRASRSDAAEPKSDVWAGLRFILRTPVLLALTVVGAVSFISAEISTVAELPLVHEFGVGGLGYGIMNTAWGAGGVLGALAAARVVRKQHEPAAAVYGILFFALFLGLVGLAPVFALVPVLFFLFAFSDPFSYVGFGGIIQRGTPDEIRGRVFGAISGVMSMSMAVAYAGAGFIVEATGWRLVYVVGGVVGIACAVALGIALRVIGPGSKEAGEVHIDTSEPSSVADN